MAQRKKYMGPNYFLILELNHTEKQTVAGNIEK